MQSVLIDTRSWFVRSNDPIEGIVRDYLDELENKV